MKVTLLRPLKVGSNWHQAGDEIEVKANEVANLISMSVIDPETEVSDQKSSGKKKPETPPKIDPAKPDNTLMSVEGMTDEIAAALTVAGIDTVEKLKTAPLEEIDKIEALGDAAMATIFQAIGRKD